MLRLDRQTFRWDLFLSALLMAAISSVKAFGGVPENVKAILTGNCLDCHDSSSKEAGVDLSRLLSGADTDATVRAELWRRVERVVGNRQMPPEEVAALREGEIEVIQTAYREMYVLRDGQPHIGATPLRRLTRYELGNTLQDLLLIDGVLPDDSNGASTKSIFSSIPSDLPGPSGFDNDASRMQLLRPPIREISESVHRAVAILSEKEALFNSVIGLTQDVEKMSESEITQVLARFVSRACRCDQSQGGELGAAYYRQYAKLLETALPPRDCLIRVIEMILVSPEFLYRLELNEGRNEPYAVNARELATRLSYFLWSTLPDDELVELANNGDLLSEDKLRQQIARMLNSPKRVSLSENFAGQWLGFKDLLFNGEYLVDEQWNRESFEEMIYFFDEMIRSDRSVLDLVDSDWLFVRESQVKATEGDYLRLTSESLTGIHADVLATWREKSRGGFGGKLDDPPVLVRPINNRQGGVITSPAVMRLTSSRSRTSPIRRGVWVLNTMIGRDLEAPSDVPPLDESRERLALIENPSVAELIQQHVSKPECVSCHRLIDPLGLGLENFSIVGQWRTEYEDRARVVSQGEMPNGAAFKNPKEMKRLLLDLYGDEIAMNFVSKLMAYAIGRKVEPHDRHSLDQIMRKVRDNGYRLNTVIEQIILSPQFRCRQDH